VNELEALRRRDFLGGGLALAGVGLLTGCGLLTPAGQGPVRVSWVGYLSGAGGREHFGTFRQGIEEHGYVVGRTIEVEFRDAEGQLDRLTVLAAELVRLPVDELVADGSSEVRAAIVATGTIPIVMAQSASPVEEGFVASLARPGGNVTGLTGASRELIGKRLELIKTTLPAVSRVGVIWGDVEPKLPWRAITDSSFVIDRNALDAQGDPASPPAKWGDRCPSAPLPDLRHGAATLLLSPRQDLTTIQTILGNSSFQITADFYTHLLPQAQERAMDRLHQLLAE
jgi:hypothetical protein